MTPLVRPLVGRSVHHKFLKGQQVTLPCSCRSTFFLDSIAPSESPQDCIHKQRQRDRQIYRQKHIYIYLSFVWPAISRLLSVARRCSQQLIYCASAPFFAGFNSIHSPCALKCLCQIRQTLLGLKSILRILLYNTKYNVSF